MTNAPTNRARLAEHLQPLLEDVTEAPTWTVGRRGTPRSAPRSRWARAVRPAQQLVLRSAAAQVQLLVLPGPGVEPVERRRFGDRHGAALVERVGVTERGDPDDGRRLLPGQREHGDLLADLEVVVLGGAAVDGDLTGGGGARPFLTSSGSSCSSAIHSRPVCRGERLAVLAEERDGPGEDTAGPPHRRCRLMLSARRPGDAQRRRSRRRSASVFGTTATSTPRTDGPRRPPAR